MIGLLEKRENLDTYAYRENEHHMIWAETGVMEQKPKNTEDSGKSPEARREAWNRSSHTTLEGTNPADTLITAF